jgi:ATP adenylyltransferase
MKYIEQDKSEEKCVFCDALAHNDGPENEIIFRGQWAFVILNRYPYTSGHLMIVPNDHQPSLEMLDSVTRAEIMELTAHALQVLGNIYRPQGYNLGMNIGTAAGAGITDHVHLHIVPRWNGDTNFMSAIGQVRVLPETLEDSYYRLQKAWFAYQDPT